jgi:hypothetical protein
MHPLFSAVNFRKRRPSCWQNTADLRAQLDSQKAEGLAPLEYDQAETILKGWRQYVDIVTFYESAAKGGLSAAATEKVMGEFGAYASEVMRHGPYAVAGVLPWAEVELMASAVDWPQSSQQRFHGAVLSVCAQIKRNGFTWLSEKDATNLMQDRLGSRELATEALAYARKHGLLGQIGDVLQDRTMFNIERALALDFFCAEATTGVPPEHAKSDLLALESRNSTDTVHDAIEAATLMRRSIMISEAGLTETLLGHPARHVKHVVPSLSAPYCAGIPKQNIVALSDTLRAGVQSEMWGACKVVFIHESHLMDTVTLNMVRRALPTGAAWCLVGQSGRLHVVGLGASFQALAEGRFVRKAVLRIGASIGRTPCPDESVTQIAKCRSSKTQHVACQAQGAAQLDEALYAFREKSENGFSVAILTARQRTADELNATLVAENLATRTFRKQPTTQLRLASGLSVTIDDYVLADVTDLVRGIVAGDRGRLVALYAEPKMQVTKHGAVVLYVGEVEFAVAGRVCITRSDLSHLRAAYALPLHRYFGTPTHFVIALAEDCRIVDSQWVEDVQSIATLSTLLVCTAEVLEKMKQKSVQKRLASSAIACHLEALA